jgi:hypothetical protein
VIKRIPGEVLRTKETVLEPNRDESEAA